MKYNGLSKGTARSILNSIPVCNLSSLDDESDYSGMDLFSEYLFDRIADYNEYVGDLYVNAYIYDDKLNIDIDYKAPCCEVPYDFKDADNFSTMYLNYEASYNKEIDPCNETGSVLDLLEKINKDFYTEAMTEFESQSELAIDRERAWRNEER